MTTPRELRTDPFIPHDHRERVEGCFRCEISEDEVMASLLASVEAEDKAFIQRVVAENRSLREQVERYEKAMENAHNQVMNVATMLWHARDPIYCAELEKAAQPLAEALGYTALSSPKEPQ